MAATKPTWDAEIPDFLPEQHVRIAHEENLVITEDGARLLSRRAPAELPVILG